MSVFQSPSGRWQAQISVKRKNRYVGTFDTEAEARAAKAEALAALPPKAKRPRYLAEDRGHETPCWVWQWAKTPKGYGTVALPRSEDGSKRWIPAHRHFYEQHFGTIPDGYQIDHLCRVHECVNPDHLQAVTQAENARRGANARLTAADVREIRLSDEKTAILASVFGVSEKHISGIRNEWAWAQDSRTEGPSRRRQCELDRAA